VRDDCGERELSDVFAATRLRAPVEHLKPDALKRLFVRLLSFSPLREGVLLGLVPVFVSRLTTSSEKEVEQIVSALEGLGTESALESLVQAVYEVSAEGRPRVLMALGAVGSPRVLEPLEKLALHSTQKADRTEAGAAVLRIASRFPGARADEAVKALRASEDAEVRAMIDARAPKRST
jgi:HEAT repeat protein